jgi:hypothetical protein
VFSIEVSPKINVMALDYSRTNEEFKGTSSFYESDYFIEQSLIRNESSILITNLRTNQKDLITTHSDSFSNIITVEVFLDYKIDNVHRSAFELDLHDQHADYIFISDGFTLFEKDKLGNVYTQAKLLSNNNESFRITYPTPWGSGAYEYGRSMELQPNMSYIVGMILTISKMNIVTAAIIFTAQYAIDYFLPRIYYNRQRWSRFTSPEYWQTYHSYSWYADEGRRIFIKSYSTPIETIYIW